MSGLTDRVVLFHDRIVHGPASAEVYDAGIGLVSGLVLLPHARRRLQTENPARMGILARRFAGERLLLLDDGSWVEAGADGSLRGEARVLGPDGQVSLLAAVESNPLGDSAMPAVGPDEREVGS